MNIKKLLVITMCVVGLAPNNTYTDDATCASCHYEGEPAGAEWRLASPYYDYNQEQEEEQEALEPIMEFVEKHHPHEQCEAAPSYESHPSPASFHKQMEPCKKAPFVDPYSPCDPQFQERLEEEEQEQAEEQPYVVIYRVE